ncbi:hypothetical protein AMK68_04365 [candidate division KD3-62 bacterium DG_56]|uniref:Uncharacterized protein n=1 Tax=candidate division KD3-62 bacterium DG_56 TaxID=1704032 RepID=A0A0S7XKY4_9BACT|nr:MAG: hypothetical protein AMK68_04365 [candidate division KD3-62 bacterium DG_56]
MRYLSYRPPPPPPRVDTLPAVLTGAGGPERVGDGHRRRASGIRWNGAVAAIYERDGDPLVVGVGDVVGPPSEEETVTAIGRDWLIVRDRAGVERRVLLGQRPRSGWRGMIED